MLDEDRGTYSPPTEDNLSYEARRRPSRDQAPLTLIVSGIILVVVLIAAVIFYNSGMNTHGRVPPEVGETLDGIKEVKVQDAQPLSDQELGDTTGARFAPGTEAPADRGTAPPAEINQAPPVAAPITGAVPSNSEVALKPATGAAASSAAPKLDPTPVPGATTAAATSGGSSIVQIGAFTTQEIATNEYNKLASSYGLFLGGTGKRIEKVQTANGTVYRTSVTGFATAEKARAFCSALKAAGHDCFVK